MLSRIFFTSVALLAGLSVSNALGAAAPTHVSWTQSTYAQAQPKPTDETLEDRVEYRLETTALIRKYDIKVKVKDGVATLSGDVATAAQKAEAERVARIDGITRVDSRIVIDPGEDTSVADRVKKGLAKTGEKITDAWITTKVKWFFLGEDELKGSEIDVDTKDNVVTLKGTVKSMAGRTKAVDLATNTDGVRRVVDQLVIKK